MSPELEALTDVQVGMANQGTHALQRGERHLIISYLQGKARGMPAASEEWDIMWGAIRGIIGGEHRT